MPNIYWRGKVSGLNFNSDNWTYTQADNNGTPGVRPDPADNWVFDQNPTSMNDAAIIVDTDLTVNNITSVAAFHLTPTVDVTITINGVFSSQSSNGIVGGSRFFYDPTNQRTNVVFNHAGPHTVGTFDIKSVVYNAANTVLNASTSNNIRESMTVVNGLTFTNAIRLGPADNSAIPATLILGGTIDSTASATRIRCFGDVTLTGTASITSGLDVYRTLDVSGFDGVMTDGDTVWRGITNGLILGTKTTLATWPDRILQVSGTLDLPDQFRVGTLYVSGGTCNLAGDLFVGQYEQRGGTINMLDTSKWVNIGHGRGPGTTLNQIRATSNARLRRARAAFGESAYSGWLRIYATGTSAQIDVLELDDSGAGVGPSQIYGGTGELKIAKQYNNTGNNTSSSNNGMLEFLAGCVATINGANFSNMRFKRNAGATVNFLSPSNFNNVDASEGEVIDAQSQKMTTTANDIWSNGRSTTNPGIQFERAGAAPPFYRNNSILTFN